MSEVLKMEPEPEGEACCVCGACAAELSSPEEHDAAAPPHLPPLRAMLLHLNNNKVIPNGRLCPNCIRRTLDAYNFSTALASKGPPPLSEKIRALRKRLHELTQKIDVFIVVGGGAGGAYSERDIIMVERAALGAAGDDDAAGARALDARGSSVYQCGVCPLTFARSGEYRAHRAAHAPGAPHACWTCGARLASAAALAEHAAEHAPPPPRCALCHLECQSSAELRAHAATCTAPARCPAEGCGARARSLAALAAHARAAHPALCAQCWLQCGSAAQLAAHALQHRRARHFVCGYKACILRFNTRSDLMSHIRKCHSGEAADDPPAPAPAAAPAPPAACALCPRTFGSQGAMKRHARSHHTKNNDLQPMEWTDGADGDKVEYLEVETLEELEQEDA